MRTKKLSCRFIADIGSNHCQDFLRCLKLIDAAKDIGCWGVKVQLFKADKLYTPEFIPRNIKDREMPDEWIPKLAKYCKARGIKFGGTPFDLEAVKVLSPHVDFLKISSFDLLRKDLIEECAKTGIDLIISTGSATGYEVLCAMETFYDNRVKCSENALNPRVHTQKIYFLHCISDYPTKIEHCHLFKINALDYWISSFWWPKEDVDIGWSDHTCNTNVIYEAYLRGAKIIEFHLDLNDKKGAEYRYGHCYTPEHIRSTIYEIQEEIRRYDRDITKEHMDKKTIEAREWRADPEDGLRPMKSMRNKK